MAPTRTQARSLLSSPHLRVLMSRPPASNRLWVRSFFEDHPLLYLKVKEAYAGSSDKPKVYCKLCLDREIEAQRLNDEREVESGARQEVRARETVILDCKQSFINAFSVFLNRAAPLVFSMEGPGGHRGRGWCAARTDTLIHHLLNCNLQPQDVYQMALNHKLGKSPSARRTLSHQDFGERIQGSPISSSSMARSSSFPYPRPPVFHVQTPSESYQSAYTLTVPGV